MEHASKQGLINRDSERRKEALCVNRAKINTDIIKKSVVQLSLTGEYIAEFDSIQETSEITGAGASQICAVCRNNCIRKSSGGYLWCYKDEYDPDKEYVYEAKYKESNCKAIIQYDLEGNFIAEYKSITDACRALHLSGGSYISEVCKGKRKHYKGFLWKYKTTEEYTQPA